MGKDSLGRGTGENWGDERTIEGKFGETDLGKRMGKETVGRYRGKLGRIGVDLGS